MSRRRARKGPGTIREEKTRRRRLRRLALPLALLLVAAGVIAFALNREDPGSREPTSEAQDLSEGPRRVLFADFSEGEQMIREHHLADDEVRDVFELPRLGQIEASPGSPYLSVEWWDEDVGAPRITILNPRTGDQRDVEEFAFEPIWHPSGDRLAYSEPLDVDACTPDDCESDVRVHVIDPSTGESEVIVPAGPWFPRFWVGDRILYQDEDDGTLVHIEGTDGERTTIDIWAMATREASPDGRWLFVSWEQETAFYPLAADGSFAGDPIAVERPAGVGWPIRVTAWSHDSAALVGTSGGAGDDLVVLSPDDPEPRTIAELGGSVTRLAWTPDNAEVLLTTASHRFRTLLCPVAVDGPYDPCREVFGWTTGISTLRVEGSA